MPYYLRRSIEVKYSPYTAEWRINGKTNPSYNDIRFLALCESKNASINLANNII